MIGQIFTQNAYKILSLFSLSPGSRLNRGEIKEMTRLNNVPLDKALCTLLSSGILKKEKSLYSIDFECAEAKIILGAISGERKRMKELPFTVYLILVDLVSVISASRDIQAYLFGSYSKLIHTENSDIDVAVLTTRGFGKKNTQRRSEKIEKTYGKKIELHFFEKDLFYRNRKDPLVKEIIKNGIRLI